MQFIWVLPSLAECRKLTIVSGSPEPGHDQAFLRHVVHTVDQLGFDGIHIPADRRGEDGMVLGAALAGLSERLSLLVGIRPSTLPPTTVARMAASLHAVADGRLLLHLASRLPEVSEDYMRQWWEAYRSEWALIQDLGLPQTPSRAYCPPERRPGPSVCYGGVSDASAPLAAELADVYFVPPRSPAEMALRIAKLRALSARQGRKLQFALRAHIVVRETDDAARRAARNLFDQPSKASMLAAAPRRKHQYQVANNLWVHAGLARDGADAAIVGNAEAVAALLREYARLGVGTFVLSGYPHLEEAARIAQMLFPLVPHVGNVHSAAPHRFANAA